MVGVQDVAVVPGSRSRTNVQLQPDVKQFIEAETDAAHASWIRHLMVYEFVNADYRILGVDDAASMSENKMVSFYDKINTNENGEESVLDVLRPKDEKKTVAINKDSQLQKLQNIRSIKLHSRCIVELRVVGRATGSLPRTITVSETQQSFDVAYTMNVLSVRIKPLIPGDDEKDHTNNFKAFVEYSFDRSNPVPEHDDESITKSIEIMVRVIDKYYADFVRERYVSVSIILELIRVMCSEMCEEQITLLQSSDGRMSNAHKDAMRIMLRGVETKLVTSVPFLVDGEYVTELSVHISESQKLVRSVEQSLVVKGAMETEGDDVTVTIQNMYKPWFTALYLASFLADPENKWSTKGHTFFPSYFDSKYAELGLHRIVFDSLVQIRRSYESYLATKFGSMEANPKNDGPYAEERQALSRLDTMTSSMSEIIHRAHIDPKQANTADMFQKVNAISSDTKDMSLHLFQVNERLEKRRSNLVVMANNEHETIKKRKKQRAWFWGVVVTYAVYLWIVMFLVYTRSFRLLYIGSGVVVIVMLLWMLVVLIQSMLSNKK